MLTLRPNLSKGESRSNVGEGTNSSLAKITYRKKRAYFSPLTCRLLVVNVVALAILDPPKIGQDYLIAVVI